jgi:hypothetical protein
MGTARAETIEPARRPSSLHILVVDDEPLVAPGQVEPGKPVVAVAKLTRGEQLLKRLKQLEKLVPPASSDFRILTKLREKIVKNEGLDQLQSGLDSLESKYKE